MPVMDGLEATRRIRQVEVGITASQKRDKHQIIIGVSANSDEDTRKESYAAGVDAFICKPFAVESFYSTIFNIRNETQPGEEVSSLTTVPDNLTMLS